MSQQRACSKDIIDVKRRVKLLGISSDQVANRAGLARSTVRRWLDGDTLPTLYTLRRAQQALGEIEAERVDG